jgi:hypothetical protein
MTECPAREQLARLLAEQLGAPDADRVEAHVQSCARCQEALPPAPFPAGRASNDGAGGRAQALGRLRPGFGVRVPAERASGPP